MIKRHLTIRCNYHKKLCYFVRLALRLSLLCEAK